MSLTLTELVDSRESVQDKGPDGQLRTIEVTLKYVLQGTSDDGAARSLLQSSTPGTYGSLVRDEITLDPEWVDTVSGDGVWDAEVRYILPEEDEPETGQSSYAFDTSGGTQHVTQSIETVSRDAPTGKTAPDHKGAIGVARRGDNKTVEGVDITIPVYNWSETHYLPDSQVTAAYKGQLFNLTGKTNNAAFKGCAAGECLFLGASGAKRGEQDWEIAFRFAASPNKSNIQIGDITVSSKKGWEYLWVEYGDAEDATAQEMAKRPIAAYVEKVYEEGDFSLLGIGT